jgi:predicted membrane GTPase involved in stress response
MCLILLFGICSILFQIELLTPKDYIGPIMELGQERRGEFKEMNYITENRAKLIYMLPLAEVGKHYCDQKHANFLPRCNLSNGNVCMKQMKGKNYGK